jgi:hypothetical protein
MRIGNRRGLVAAFALVAAACVGAGEAKADWGIKDAFDWMHTIPRVTYAKDYRTGGIYYAPPIPYGHYAKDPIGHVYNTASGAVHGAAGHVTGAVHQVAGKLCGACGGKGCGTCGGTGLLGHGHGGGGDAGCTDCMGGHGGGAGGHGLGHGGPYNFAGGYGGGAVPAGYAVENGHGGLFKGLLGHKKAGHGAVMPTHGGMASPQGVPVATPQGAVYPTGQAAGHGFGGHKGLFGGHDGNVVGAGAGLCGGCGGQGSILGNGCGGCGGDGLCGNGNDPCGPDGQCGLCRGNGLFNGGPCGACGGTGHCKEALGKLAGKAHGALGYLKGLHPKNKIKYFVGPGGPVPLTPGYVPYINPVRSPRDFFAFPPFVDQAMDGGAETWNYNTVTPASVTVPAAPAPGLIPIRPAFPLGGRQGAGAPEAGLGAGGDSEPMDDDVLNRGQAPGTTVPTTPGNNPIPGDAAGGASEFPGPGR